MTPSFETVLPRLAALHQQGRLIPFIGSGMSVGACNGWPAFVEGLEEEAEIDPDEHDKTPTALIRRAERAVRQLKQRGSRRFADAIRVALDEHASATPQTSALMKSQWPLVISTNYDDVLLRGAPPNTVVCGRSPLHCQRIVASRSTVDAPIVWVVQGYAGTHSLVPGDVRKALAEQLVVGHREYCEVTFFEPVFRRTFAHIYTNSSLLFLGSGLAEDYIQNLFSEIVGTFGLPRTPHFALMHHTEAARASSFLARNLGIVTCAYRDHAELPAMLERLSETVRAPGRLRSLRFSCSYDGVDHQIEVTARPLRMPRVRSECVGVSAGFEMRVPGFTIWLGQQGIAIQNELKARGLKLRSTEDAADPAAQVYDMGHSVYAVVARRPDRGARDVRDLRTVSSAMSALLRRAYQDGYRGIEVGLLAGSEKSRWEPGYSVIEMVRGIRQVLAAGDFAESVNITISVVDDNVMAKVWNGGVDVSSLLSSSTIDCWVIVGDDEPGNRVRVFCDETDTVTSLAERLDVRGDWSFAVHPLPAHDEPERCVSRDGSRTLAEIGLVPGGTLHFDQLLPRRPQRPSAGADAAPRTE